MSGEMIERATEALIAKWRIHAGPGDRPDVPFWRDMARAAIEAMREPTEQMVDACDINIPTEGMIIGVWTDMIDAALGDSVTEALPEAKKTL